MKTLEAEIPIRNFWLQDMINIDKLFKHLLVVKVVILLLLFPLIYFGAYDTLVESEFLCIDTQNKIKKSS